ncbi:MAG: response regulator [Candidatus Aenigmarchaeota archaeon]|nr:response regulator [Candidatus Aenigmarchaeota archaeon]
MSRILLVEDNPRYASSAEQYLVSRRQAVVVARDYAEAVNRLETGKPTSLEFDGAIVDCFFPEITGSGKTDIGNGLVRRMAKSDPQERKIVEGLEKLGQYIDLEDPTMKKYARFAVGVYDPNSPVFKAVEQVFKAGGRPVATLAFKNTLELAYREDRSPRNYYGTLMKAIEESEANQPLGILVAERADELALPFVLATSTSHHDLLTQPVQNYASDRRWTLVDCGPNREDDKASAEFWERAFRELERKLR